MAKQPMTQNQQFAFLVFAIVMVVGVVLVYLYIQGGIDRM